MSFANNHGEHNYPTKIQSIANKLKSWQGPIVIVSHVDPDGDALGSTLGLKRALDSMGKPATLIINPQRFLHFLVHPDELSKPISELPENCLLMVMDVAEAERIEGAPMQGASFVINIDHHGTNDRFGDIACVQPDKAATAQMTKDIINALAIPWTPDMATACLTGILTDTGNFRYTNTNPEVLKDAAELLSYGVDYATLTDRLQWRHPDYFQKLGKVMSTVEFFLDGLVVIAKLTKEMDNKDSADDSNDYVGLIRYAEGVKVAILLKEGDGTVKVSTRTRDGVSAQAICLSMGGGGHVAAAGAKVTGTMDEAQEKVLEASKQELLHKGFLQV
jgi:phosphoesterase RecJ-like protein